MEKHTSKIIFILVVISLSIYACLLFYLLFYDSRGAWTSMPFGEYLKYSINVIPFKTISQYIMALFDGSMNMDIPIKNLFGNMLVFAPLGFYLPFFSKNKMTILKCIGFSCIMIILLEALQIFTRTGSFDIDDLILNIIGVAIGFMIFKNTLLKWLQN